MNDFQRLFDILPYQAAKYPKEDCLCYKYDGTWKKYNTSEVTDIVNRVSRAFIKFGLKPGDKVGLISPNRPEWNFVDIGMLQVGVVNVPIYPTISEADYKFIFNDAEIKVAFVADRELFEKIHNIKKESPSLIEIFSFDKVAGCKNFSDFLEMGDDDTLVDEVKNISEKIKPEELATIIYTSGTTGVPKGVMLSHYNVVSNIKSVITVLPIGQTDRTLSFLPLCHIFERVVLYTYMAVGASVYYAESLEKLKENIAEVKPSYFSCVPRLLEKVYDGIVTKALAGSWIKQKIFFWAVELGMTYDGGPRTGLQWQIADALVFSKVREALGGNIKGIVTGAAALQERLCRVFNAMGVTVREGYGQTETSPVISINRFEPGGFKYGTIGMVIPGVEVKIGENNEILVKGPNVMMGYYKRPDLTSETIDKDGWLHTGDCGEFVEGKFLKITDRVKELFKTSGGKYVAPQVIENKMKESRYIEQICVLGENERFVSALIVPSFTNVTDWATKHALTFKSFSDLVNSPDVNSLIKSEIEELNKNFGKIEQIKKFKLVATEWSIESGELTPTMKVKRKVVLAKYQKEIKDLYAE